MSYEGKLFFKEEHTSVPIVIRRATGYLKIIRLNLFVVTLRTREDTLD